MAGQFRMSLLLKRHAFLLELQCHFSGCGILMKSHPSTVGVPVWAKAAKKRQAQVLLLNKKKTARQMQAEKRLADVDTNKSDFFTTSRVGVHRPKSKPHSQEIVGVAATHNQKMLVFYHPANNYPVSHTKVVNNNDWMTVSDDINDYSDNVSESQITEIQSLQDQDPKLWTADVLSHMYKVKPLAISAAAPLTPEQQLELEVEEKFLSRLSDYEKEEYSRFQDLERKKVLRKRSRKAVKD